MKYNRKPQQPVSVTLSVSWIEEPVTIPSVNSLPMDILVKAQVQQDPSLLAGALRWANSQLEQYRYQEPTG